MSTITFARSSSINNFESCQQQHFLTYELGYQGKTGLKAAKGSAVHKALEDLAIIKKYLQENPKAKKFEHEGQEFKVSDLYKEITLTDAEVDKTNKARINKNIYKYDCSIEYRHKRIGVEIVDYLIDKSTKYFSKTTQEEWSKADFRDCREWLYIALDYSNRQFDPRFSNVVAPEQAFDISLEYLPWSKYSFKLDGKKYEGHYSVKGTIDLTIEENGVLHVIDYKTGEKTDFATGAVKDHNYLQEKDKQLLLYYWAIRKTFPKYKNVLITIFFIRAGGPYTVIFEEKDMLKAEKMLKDYFESNKKMEVPTLVPDEAVPYKCARLCAFHKNKWAGTDKTICQFIHGEIKSIGKKEVVETYRNPMFTPGFYKPPGE